MLSLAGVSLRRGGREVLAGVDATLAAGKLTAIIGPNGAGKSSLMAVAAGLLAPTSGTVAYDGVPIAGWDRRRLATRRAYLPQDAGVEWPISVERVVELGMAPQRGSIGRNAIAAAVERALAAHDLLALRHRAATALSGGERARVMLARATVATSALLLADEPIAGLDPRHALDTLGRWRGLAEAGCTVVVALHDLSLALRFADAVLALRDSRIVGQGPAGEVLTPALLERLYDVPARVSDDGFVLFEPGKR